VGQILGMRRCENPGKVSCAENARKIVIARIRYWSVGNMLFFNLRGVSEERACVTHTLFHFHATFQK
jgi:hypothetical protein